MAWKWMWIAPVVGLWFIEPAVAQPRDSHAERIELTAPQVFALAEAALGRGDDGTAEAIYRALVIDPDTEIRTEANFRLGMMLARLGRHSEAARLFRQILDTKPDAQRVRLELARVLDLIGDEAGARRALGEAQAGGLPPEVARFVDRYSAALRSRKPFGASFELALAPDSNINRATRSDTLGTVLGDFTLDKDAQETSGIGAALRGQVYARARIGKGTNLLARANGAADLYRRGDFNDISLGVGAGPEFQLGRDRLTAEAGATWRWFGNNPYSATAIFGLNFLHTLDPRSQLRATAALGLIDNKRNRLQDGQSYTLSLSYERALSNRAGIGLSLAGDRQSLRDPGYSITSGQLILFGYREIGAATLIGTLGYGRLEADRRLFIYPRRRIDKLYRATLGATFRQFAIGSFAPLVRVTLERNRSSVEIFDYRRARTEFGITRAF